MSSGTLSPIGRVAYPNIQVARKRNDKPGTKARFSTTLVYGPEIDLTAFKAAVRAVVAEKYPKGIPEGFRSPFRPGTCRRKEDGSYPEGFSETDTFVEFWRYEEHGTVPCVDAQRNELLPGDIYAGMTGRVAYRAFCYNVDGNKGVSLGLEAFQKAADGTPIGAAPVNPQTAFDSLGEQAGTPAVSAPAVSAPAGDVSDLW